MPGEYLTSDEARQVELSRLNWFKRRKQVAEYIAQMNSGGVTIEPIVLFPIRLRRHLWRVAVERETADEEIEEIRAGVYTPEGSVDEYTTDWTKVRIDLREVLNGEDI